LINPTGIDQSNAIGLSLNIYPNPVRSFLNVEGEYSELLNFEIISLLGERMLSGVIHPNKKQINLSDLPQNVYFLRIGNNSFKFLKTE